MIHRIPHYLRLPKVGIRDLFRVAQDTVGFDIDRIRLGPGEEGLAGPEFSPELCDARLVRAALGRGRGAKN